jgi:hypothetical protein
VLHYTVWYDSLKRASSFARVRDGETDWRVSYEYNGADKFRSAYSTFLQNGEVSGRTKFTRNARGEIIRIDDYTGTGELTGYSTRTLIGDSAVQIAYTRFGSISNKSVSWFNDWGTLKKTKRTPNDTTYYENDYNSITGLITAARKYDDGRQVTATKYLYDKTSALIQTDTYTADGVWYGRREFRKGLEVRHRYKFADGTLQETRSVYDANRRLQATSFEVNGVLICTLRYDRHPNGAIKRTIAVSPNGALMAEYPNLDVRLIERNGEALDHPGIAILYKKGDWW